MDTKSRWLFLIWVLLLGIVYRLTHISNALDVLVGR